MLPLTPIFQNMTFIHYVQRLANVTKIAKFNLHSILRFNYVVQKSLFQESDNARLSEDIIFQRTEKVNKAETT